MDFSGVVRQQLRGEVVIRYTGLLLFGLKCGHVVKRQCTDSHGFCLFCGVLTRVAAKNDDVEQAVAHQAVAPVDAAHDLASSKQVFHIRLAVCRDVQTAILIVQRRIDQDRLLACLLYTSPSPRDS